MLYYITYSCGCGENDCIVKADSQDKALDYAYELAMEEYDSYAGLHGIRSIDDIIEEEKLDEDDLTAWDIYTEERENSLSYSVDKYEPKYHGDLDDYYIHEIN